MYYILKFVAIGQTYKTVASLDGIGKVEAKNGWLSLIRNNESGFTIRLKEYFDPEQERKLEICINSNGEKDYVKITQKGGQTYKIIKGNPIGL